MGLPIKKFQSGQVIVELLIAFGLAGVLLPALLTGLIASRNGKVQQEQRIVAVGLLREGEEAVRNVREADWANIASLDNTKTYHPVAGATSWSLQQNPETIGDFTRSITVSDLTPKDPSLRKITVTVHWSNILPTDVSSSFFLTRWKNLTWVQTTYDDFNNVNAKPIGTVPTNTAGGEVVLGSGGTAKSDWCDPAYPPSPYSWEYNLDGSASPNAISASLGTGGEPNKLVAGTGNSNNGVTLDHLAVTNTNPPAISEVGKMPDSSPRIKTNAVYTSGNYAYVATDNKHKEVIAVSLSSHTEVGYYDSPVNGNGAGIYVYGTIGFVTIGSTLYTFDTSNFFSDTKSMTQLGSINLSGNGARLIVSEVYGISGKYAFVSESTGSRPLEVVRFSDDGKTLNIVAWSVISGQNGVDIVVNSTASRGYLATSQGKVYIINTSGPYSGVLPVPVGIFDTNGMSPKGVAVVTNNKAIVVGTGGSLQYQVIDITTESSPSLCTEGGKTSGGLAIPGGANAIASLQEDDGDAYSYVATNDSANEIKIIQGGPGGGGGVYTTDGTYESVIFDAGHSVMFNRFDATAATPTDTTIQYKMAITDPVSGSCAGATYTFVGPDKTTGTFFNGSSALPQGTSLGFNNPGQCLKFKVYMHTSNTNNSPVLYDITFNYSP